MKVKFNDLYLQNKVFFNEFNLSFKDALKKSKFIGGPEVDLFEKNFKKIFKAKYSISVANGTDALIISLKCLGISYGDEVIVPTHTWVSTAGAVVAVGAIPIFVDTDDYFTIDVKKIEKKISKNTKAIIPVHLYGQPCDMEKILKIAKKFKLKIIEDCAQAHLTKYKDKIVGNFGDIGTFSFFPGKNLGALGDAGMIITNKKDIFNRIRQYKNHGSIKKNDHQTFGVNSRLDSIQAQVLNKKIKNLNILNEKRKKIAKSYYKELKKNKFIELPNIREFADHTFHQFVIKVKKNKYRFPLIKFLKSKGVETSIHYPKMLNNLRPYKVFGVNNDYESSQNNEAKIISLPIHPFLKKEEIKYVINSINSFFSRVNEKQ